MSDKYDAQEIVDFFREICGEWMTINKPENGLTAQKNWQIDIGPITVFCAYSGECFVYDAPGPQGRSLGGMNQKGMAYRNLVKTRKSLTKYANKLIQRQQLELLRSSRAVELGNSIGMGCETNGPRISIGERKCCAEATISGDHTTDLLVIIHNLSDNDVRDVLQLISPYVTSKRSKT